METAKEINVFSFLRNKIFIFEKKLMNCSVGSREIIKIVHQHHLQVTCGRAPTLMKTSLPMLPFKSL